METAHIIYTGDLRTSAVHLQSGTEIITDAPTDNQGKGEAFSPTDLVATALGSCMMTIMGIAARSHGLNLEGTSLKITKIMHPEPRRIGEVKIEINFPEGEYTEKHKKILQHCADTCPVALSLHPDVKQTVKLNFTH
ncbi:MAG: OsmC family protein [Bacteroidales bacterium]